MTMTILNHIYSFKMMSSLDKLTFILSDDGAYYAVKALNTSISGDVVIPAEYEGKPVKEIRRYAFAACKSLTSINIPDSVTVIGHGAFTICTALTSINIPNSVASIGSYAFAACKSLTSINIPDSVTTVGENIFNHCQSLATNLKLMTIS